MRAFALVLFLLAAALLAPPLSFAQSQPRHVDVSLVSARAAIAPGESVTIALRQRIQQGWHTYWRNPGAAGEPAELTWTLPEGFSAGPIQWPAPEPIVAANLINYGYAEEVLLPIVLRAPARVRPGQTATLSADVFLVVCSDDVCVPEESTVTLDLPIAASGRDDSVWGPRLAAAVAALPKREARIEAHISGGAAPLLSVAYAGGVRDPYFFPFSRDALDYETPQRPSVGADGFSIALADGVDRLGGAPLEGVVTFEDAQGQRQAFELSAQPGAPLPNTSGAAPAPAASPQTNAPGLIAALAFAFLGGLILNIMPCVLPVLSVKALSFVGGAQAGRARRDGLLYAAGVLTTFLALAGVLVALRGAGEAAGWGFQFQSPYVSAGLALLFFAIGLNLLGVFGGGASLQGAGAGLAARGGGTGAFFTGALAVIVATPCTAPFMAGAIGAALTQSAAAIFLVFAALGLGFALPLTALHFTPGLQRLLPKPGAWMERFKQVLAFPMFAAAAWLVWVLTEQRGAAGAGALLAVAVALAFALYTARWGRVWLIAALVILAATASLAWRPLGGHSLPTALASETWSSARVAALRAEGRPVFVNFTAAWCVTCKINEAAALRSPRVAQAFAAHNAAYLEADWTNRDAAIAAALAEHGRAGVPLYLYYPPGAEAVALPQILTEDTVIHTLEGGAS